jgi:ACS family hexuronate transporter-like MFS transporter
MTTVSSPEGLLRGRWIAASVFALSSMLNYLDRLLLASVAPLVIHEFHLSNEDYGWLLSGLALAYALASPLTGMLLDRLGFSKGGTLAVGAWSGCCVASAATSGFGGLMATRVGLGLAESAGIPAYAKMNATYLAPGEQAIGLAISQVGLSLGGVLAPVLVYWMLPHYSWRAPFVVAGALGLLWIPLWLAVAKAIPAPARASQARPVSAGTSWTDRRMLVLAGVNILWMGTYVLWSNFTTLFLTHTFHETARTAATYAWFPPVTANLGGFFGGWLSLRWIRSGVDRVEARVRAILVSAVGCLITLAVPLAPGSLTATMLIGASYFAAVAGSVNVYAIPLDLFGAAGAATATSMLVAAYGLLQTFLSPVIGRFVDTQGFGPVCVLVALPPLAGWAVLRWTFSGTRSSV